MFADRSADDRTARISGYLHRNQRSSAFTLLEVMIAVVLFAVGTVFVMDLLHRAQAGQSDGENALIATHLAQRCLEELRNVSYANLPSATCTIPSGYSRFTYTLSVTTPYTNLRQISVIVSWSAVGGTSSDVTLQTYRSNV